MGFGTNGFTTTSTNARANDATGGARSLVIQSDGKFVVVGSARTASGDYVLAFARYNTDGTLDTTFGTNGTSIQHVPNMLGGGAQLTPVKLFAQPDGSFVVIGNGYSGGGLSSGFTLKLSYQGLIDTSYGSNGSVPASDGMTNFGLYDAVQDSDGSIFFGGYYSASGQSSALFGKLGPSGCVFHAQLDIDSTRIWTAIPRQPGHLLERGLAGR